MLVLLALIGPALVVGCAATVAVFHLPGLDPASPQTAQPVARVVERQVQARQQLARFVRARMNPTQVTGLALSLAFGAVIVVSLLAYEIRTTTPVVRLDRDVANWAAAHAAHWTHTILLGVTDIGSTVGIISIALTVAIIETWRTRSRWVVPFLVLTIAGELALATLIKNAVGRFRPAIDPVVGLSHTSFPSGHSTSAAATLAACAFLISRRRSPRTRAALTGAAVAVAVAVAASRVLLDVHWLSDVIAGLMLGWGWFALCAIAFGGRLLIFGAPVELAERAHDPSGSSRTMPTQEEPDSAFASDTTRSA
jgi:membrane-associated phospholipid phosphatase